MCVFIFQWVRLHSSVSEPKDEVNLGFIHSGHTQTQRTCHILSPDAQWHGPLVGGQFNFSLPSVAAYSGSYASCWQAAGFMSHKKRKLRAADPPTPLTESRRWEEQTGLWNEMCLQFYTSTAGGSCIAISGTLFLFQTPVSTVEEIFIADFWAGPCTCRMPLSPPWFICL